MARNSKYPDDPDRDKRARALRALVGDVGDQELARLVDVFHDSARDCIERARHALMNRDTRVLHRQAHTLRAMSRAIAFDEVASAADELEQLLRPRVRVALDALTQIERERVDELLSLIERALVTEISDPNT